MQKAEGIQCKEGLASKRLGNFFGQFHPERVDRSFHRGFILGEETYFSIIASSLTALEFRFRSFNLEDQRFFGSD